MAQCVNHPMVETDQACVRCRQPFCDNCLVEFQGQPYCGPCRDQTLAEMQGLNAGPAPLAGTGQVQIGNWLSRAWDLVVSDAPTFMLAGLIAVLLSILCMPVLYGPLIVGLYLLVFRKMTQGTIEPGQVFDGFRRFLWAFLGMLIIMGIYIGASTLVSLPAMLVRAVAGDNFAVQIIASAWEWLASVAVSFLIAGVTMFMFPYIAARNANPVEALQASWEVVRRNLLMFCIAVFLFQLVSLLGAVACCVGVFFTMPLSVAAISQAYADHFGLEGWDRGL
jgi:hypothetical protein